MRKLTINFLSFNELAEHQQWYVINEWFYSPAVMVQLWHEQFLIAYKHYRDEVNNIKEVGGTWIYSHSYLVEEYAEIVRNIVSKYWKNIEEHFQGLEYYRVLHSYHDGIGEYAVYLYPTEGFFLDELSPKEIIEGHYQI